MSNYSQNKNIPGPFVDPNVACLKCGYHSKEPPHGRRVKYYSCSSLEITNWVKHGNNVGATSLTGYAVFIDGDTEEIRSVVENWINTFWWSTGKPEHRQYALFLKDEPLMGAIPLTDGGYIKTMKGYVIIPPSIHPNGRRYGEEINDVPIATVSKSDLIEKFRPYFKRKQPNTGKRAIGFKRFKRSIGGLRLEDIIDVSKLRQTGSKYQGSHPIHGSESGSNFVVDVSRGLWHCFRCGTGGSVLEWIAVSEGVLDCSEILPGAIRGLKFWDVVAKAHDIYGLDFDDAARVLQEGGSQE